MHMPSKNTTTGWKAGTLPKRPSSREGNCADSLREIISSMYLLGMIVKLTPQNNRSPPISLLFINHFNLRKRLYVMSYYAGSGFV